MFLQFLVSVLDWLLYWFRRFSIGASSSQITSPSPPSSDLVWKYDVFLSFRGADTRKGITSDLYERLQSSGIKTFMDDSDLQVGDAISRSLIEAIEGSRFAIVVLSRDYASSTWCLEELAKICECMEDQNRILPLFYHVDPCDVRYQKNSFAQAFSKHEISGRHESQKVKQWRGALNKVAAFSGWNTNHYKTHKELIDVIVDVLRSKVVPEAIQSTGDFQEFEATRQAMDEVMKALKDDEVNVVGVYGMGGVGKTSLVEHVGAHARKSGIFDYVTKCVVSQNPDIEKLQDTLAELQGFKLHEKTEIGRAARLSKEIKRREKILIILDDIWEKIDLSRIGIPSYKELQKCNSKVLLTTRISNVCYAMECQRKVTLNILSEPDSWALFVSKTRRSFESPTFEGVAKMVAGECMGLPVALIAVARALGDKELSEWKRAAQRLEKSQAANPNDYREAYGCIKLSYDHLRNEDYRSYFLLCCLFPEDYDIPVEDLFKYAIGKGLFQNAETLEEARDEAYSVAMHLRDSCLLLDSDKQRWTLMHLGRKREFVRMHDVVRDTAIQIAQSEDGHGFLVKAGCGLRNWPRQLQEDYSAISLMRNSIRKLPEKLVCPKLQILLLSYSPIEEIPETFFQSLNELRVLDLSGSSLSILPKSLSLLTNLQALYLDYCCSIIDTSMLGKLKKLEILSMQYVRSRVLSKEIGGLTNLRMLDITSAYRVILPSEVISKLHNLEELYMLGFWAWGSKVEGEEETNAGFDEVTSLSNLRVLKVCMSDADCIPKYVEFKPNWVEFLIRIGKFEVRDWIDYDLYSHNFIRFELDTISHIPEWFRDDIMQIADDLSWKGGMLIDIFVECEHGRLQGLKYLSVWSSRNKSMNTITWVPKEPLLENLKDLNLYSVDCSQLCAVEFLPHGSLFNLKVLTVDYCSNWWNILLPSMLLQRLLNLEELRCSGTDGSVYVLEYEALLVLKQLKLKKIYLSRLATVSMCNGPAPPATFQNLQSLSIRNCLHLQGSLFTYDVAQCLSQLNSLVLDECLSLERIVEAGSKKTVLPKLKKLSLKDLPMVYYESASFFDLECPSLEELSIDGCKQLHGSLFTYDVAQCLSQFNGLELFNCPLLERIVEASDKKIILPKLKLLRLKKLPMLCYESATLDIECPSLEHLRVMECPSFSASTSDFHSKKQVRLRDVCVSNT